MVNKSIFIKIFICSIFIVVLSTSLCTSSSYAAGIGEIFEKGKGFLEAGNDIDEIIDERGLVTTSNYIYRALTAIAVVVAVAVAMILGIQFMVASADEKAKVKEAIIPFIVGCIVVFGAFTIWKMVVNIGNEAEDTIEGVSIETTSDEDLQQTRTENSDLLARVHNGEIDNFTDAEVKRAYTTNNVDTDLAGWTKTQADSRSRWKSC